MGGWPAMASRRGSRMFAWRGVRAEGGAGRNGHGARGQGEAESASGEDRARRQRERGSASGEDDDAAPGVLPPLAEGDRLELRALKPEQKFTQPPPRFTEAT